MAVAVLAEATVAAMALQFGPRLIQYSSVSSMLSPTTKLVLLAPEFGSPCSSLMIACFFA